MKVWIYKGQVLPQKDNKGSKLVNAMSESTLNGVGNRRDGRRRFDRGERRGDRPNRNFNRENKPEAKEGGK